jgi:outer membrane biosynthesis protein TonB
VAAENEQAAHREAARREATARAEAVRLEAIRLDVAAAAEAARREAQRAEAARAEADRQHMARLEAQRLQVEREAARLALERKGAAPPDPARQQAVQADQEREARREAVLRAIGRQLDEEAAQRDRARQSEDQARGQAQSDARPPAWSALRRGRLWGRADANAELVLYAEAWARRIQLNTPPDAMRLLAQRPHTRPLVTVAMRRDGSVESVTFVVASGVPELDLAIRRLVFDFAPHPVFSPALARDYDVIEIRRTWSFDSAVRLD